MTHSSRPYRRTEEGTVEEGTVEEGTVEEGTVEEGTVEATADLDGTPARITVVDGDPSYAAECLDRLAELVRRFAPEGPDSEILAINASPGSPVGCSLETLLLVSVTGWGRDSGTVDTERSTVTVPVGITLAPGLLGPALAVDMVLHDLEQSGAAGAGVTLGGITRVAGASPDGGSWSVGAGTEAIRLGDGAVLTSDGRTVIAATAHEAAVELRQRLVDSSATS